MDVTIRLLGPPGLERGGLAVRPPRGRKTWALLAYLVLHDHPVSRHHLAELLFADADDPLGALRWALAELRRAIGLAGALSGDPLVLGLDGVDLDVRSVAGHDRDRLLDARGELLEGITVDGCPLFESWLVVERYRLSAEIEARLCRTAAELLAEERAADAVPFASQAVARNVLDQGNHELLVRCLAAAGDAQGALRQVAVCQDVLRRELGIAASPSLAATARTVRPTGGAVATSGRAAVQSLIDAGRAALAAGAVEAGLDCLYRAESKAAAVSDGALHGRALLALGSALVHGVRGRDGEGAVVLHECRRIGTTAGDDATVMTACRELGFVEVQAGRRATAAEWLTLAASLATDDASRASVLGVQGMNGSDAGRYADATACLQTSAELAERCGDARQQAWSLSILGRVHLLCDERAQAGDVLARSVDLVQAQRWLAFLPWPKALQAELHLAFDDPATVADELEHTWALSCQLGDPCWQGMTARVLGLLDARRGDGAGARTWLDIALARCDAVTDTYQWVRAYTLDASIEVARASGDEAGARRQTDELAALAARTDMREMVVRAHLHRGRLGDRDAVAAGRLLAVDVDNPALHHLVDQLTEPRP